MIFASAPISAKRLSGVLGKSALAAAGALFLQMSGADNIGNGLKMRGVALICRAGSGSRRQGTLTAGVQGWIFKSASPRRATAGALPDGVARLVGRSARVGIAVSSEEAIAFLRSQGP